MTGNKTENKEFRSGADPWDPASDWCADCSRNPNQRESSDRPRADYWTPVSCMDWMRDRRSRRRGSWFPWVFMLIFCLPMMVGGWFCMLAFFRHLS